LDQLAIEREEIAIERNGRQVARILPAPARQTALEVMADLYRTLPDDAAATWEADSRKHRSGSYYSQRGETDESR
jgi:antitoxin (DNA-binding transcriptional repressor) of toxin-antitoxin stability system